MDYANGYFRAAILTTIIILGRSQSDRDIILTPKLSSQIQGKTLYYNPSNEIASNSVGHEPWEKILKHLSYLTLFTISNDQTDISQNIDYKQFMNSTYIKSNTHAPNFGDIVTLAEGRLEKTSDTSYKFIEGSCLDECKEKVIAQWLVQKIRHRDTDKSFRYEIKFVINPNYKESKYAMRATDFSKRITRSFILRDYDYPENFLLLDEVAAQRRFDQNQQYLQRLHRFNEVFMQPAPVDERFYTSDNPVIPELNIGEFIHEQINPIRRQIHYSKPTPHYKRFIAPTTYRPNYKFKGAKQPVPAHHDRHHSNVDQAMPIKAPLLATHLHHHYYVADMKFNDDHFDHASKRPVTQKPFRAFDASQLLTPTPIHRQIPYPPNYAHPLIYNSHDVKSMPTFQIMEPLTRVYHYLYNFQDSSLNNKNPKRPYYYPEPTKPFIQSPKYENVRYSEPDPLYKDLRLKNDNTIVKDESPSPSPFTFSSVESGSEIESPYPSDQNTEQNQYIEEKPQDVIIAQLPAPEGDHVEAIPYLGTSHLQEASAAPEENVSDSSNLKISDSISVPSYDTVSSPPDLVRIPFPDSERSPASDSSDDSSLDSISIPSPDPSSIPSNTVYISSTETNLLDEPIEIVNAEPHFKATTERAVLKWKAKRPTPNDSDKLSLNSLEIDHRNVSITIDGKSRFTFERAPDEDTSQRIYTIPNPTKDTVDVEVPTKQSFSTSISIKVGTGKDEPVVPFVPTISVPNVEVFKAKVEQFPSNATDVKLFKTVEKDEKPIEDEHELTQSIVKHAKSLSN